MVPAPIASGAKRISDSSQGPTYALVLSPGAGSSAYQAPDFTFRHVVARLRSLTVREPWIYTQAQGSTVPKSRIEKGFGPCCADHASPTD